MSIQITAIICTFNREAYLAKAIQSLVDQTLDNDLYEIIVVDNNSTDNTCKIVTEDFSHIDNLSYLFEPIQGLSQARNTGWKNAGGEFVAYLDDDAIASPQWLEKILLAFKTIRPQPGVVGGKIEAIWETPRPFWLSDKLARSLTIIDWSDKPKFFDDNREWLAGANIAYPKVLLKQAGGFNVNLGRKAHNLISCEENLLHHQLKQQGHRIYYHPEISIQHHIHSSRLVKEWHFKRRYWGGFSSSILEIYISKPSTIQRWKNSVKIIRKEIMRDLKKLLKLNWKNQEIEAFELKCFLLSRLGYIHGLMIFYG